MIGETKLKRITDTVLKSSRADQTEVLISTTNHHLTRFANSQIHQNMGYEDSSISVRAIVGKKIGVASTNKLDKHSLAKTAQEAYEIALLQQEDPHFVSLPQPQTLPVIKGAFVQNTAGADPQVQAKMVKTVIDMSQDKKLIAAGALDTTVGEICIGNSLGVWGYHAQTASDFSTVLTGSDKTGFASQYEKDIQKLDPEKIADTAIAKAAFPKKPIALKAGEYEVILEPNALAGEFLFFYAMLGPNARVFYEGSSHLTGHLGEKLYSDKLSITDDPLAEEGMPIPFDFEGYPKKALPLVEQGVASHICYDSYTANKYKQQNTGHALPAPNTYGPIPLHLSFQPGTKSVDEMVASVKRGIYITRFWYIRMLHPMLLNVTGMTRDGTFLIENGEIVAPVKNMRFTQSIPDAFLHIVDLGKDVSLQGSWGGAYLVPAMHISKFHFTGVTLF